MYGRQNRAVKRTNGWSFSLVVFVTMCADALCMCIDSEKPCGFDPHQLVKSCSMRASCRIRFLCFFSDEELQLLQFHGNTQRRCGVSGCTLTYVRFGKTSCRFYPQKSVNLCYSGATTTAAVLPLLLYTPGVHMPTKVVRCTRA